MPNWHTPPTSGPTFWKICGAATLPSRDGDPLNEGSYGLLMDPTNGVAHIEMRTLRLVSNYGFLEDPIRLLRAVRLSTRLGWLMDERTKQRFDNAMGEDVFPRSAIISVGMSWKRLATRRIRWRCCAPSKTRVG